MAQASTLRFSEGANFYVLDQLSGPGGVLYTSGDVTDLSAYVYDLDSSDPRTAIFSATGIAPSGVVLDTPSVNNGTWIWREDDVGANLAYQLTPSSWSPAGGIGGHLYRIEIVANTVSDGVARSVTEARCASLVNQ